MSINIIDNENAPATINWRNNRINVWAKLRAQREADFTAAAKHTGADEAAKYANDRIRGAVRSFMAEILKRGSQTAVLDFLANAPPDWIPKTERLFDDGELVPRLIRRAYPFVTWAKDISDLEKTKAQIDESWGAWTGFYFDKLGYQVASGAKAAGKAAGKAADALGGFAIGLGNVIKYAPYILAGGAVVLVVASVVRR